jgi:DnaD/phage-associated family protein
MAKVDRIREENRNSAIKGWDKRKTMGTQSQPNATAEQTKAKAMQGEEKRVEENIREESRGEKNATDRISNLIKIYEGNIGIATPMVLDELTYIADNYPDGWFADAVKESVTYNKRNIAYVKKILSTWESEGRSNGQRKEKIKDPGW